MKFHSFWIFFFFLPTVAWAAEKIFAETEIKNSRAYFGVRSEDLEANDSLDVFRSLGLTLGTYQKLRINQAASMRGARSEHLGVYLDGVQINDLSTVAGSADLSLLSGHAGQLRVSLLPQTVRLGENAFSGAVELSPKVTSNSKLEFETDSFGLLSLGGNFDTEKLDFHIQASQSDGISSSDGPNRPLEKDRASELAAVSIFKFENGQMFFSARSAKSDEDGGAFDDDPNAESETQAYSFARKWYLSQDSKLIFSAQRIDRKFSDKKDSATDFEINSQFLSEVLKIQYQQKKINIFQDVDLWWEVSSQHQLAEFSKDQFSKTDYEVAAEPVWQLSDFTWLEFGARKSESSIGEGRLQGRVRFGYENLAVDLSSSERTPSFFQKYSEYGNSQLKLEKQVTLGFLAQLPLDINLLLYESRFENLVSFDSQINKYLSFDRTRNRGIEIDWLNPFVTLRVSYLEVWDFSSNQRLMQFPLWKLVTMRKLAISDDQTLQASLTANGSSIQFGTEVKSSKALDLKYIYEKSWGNWNLEVSNIFNESRVIRAGYLEPGCVLRLGLGYNL